QGSGKRVGETIDNAIRDIKQSVNDVKQNVREQFSRARESVHAMSVEARVYSRLHWDKDLNKVQFEIEIDRDGVATLKGTVADPERAGARPWGQVEGRAVRARHEGGPAGDRPPGDPSAEPGQRARRARH